MLYFYMYNVCVYIYICVCVCACFYIEMDDMDEMAVFIVATLQLMNITVDNYHFLIGFYQSKASNNVENQMPRTLGNFGAWNPTETQKWWADVENYGVQRLEPRLEALKVEPDL